MRKSWYLPAGLVGLLLLGWFLWQQKDRLNQGCPVMAHEFLTTESGLKSLILHPAPENAQKAQKGQTVSVHYTGWLYDESQPESKGKKFDSSLDRGQPIQFVLGSGMVIKGWEEGIELMKVGEKRRLIIPAQLGYGSNGFPGVIPPNATLVFDVELVNVQ